MSAIQRMKIALVAYVLAGLLLVTGLIFLMAAGTIWLSERYGAVPATSCIGGGFIALAIVVLIIFKIRTGAKTKRMRKRERNNDMKKAAIATGVALLPTLLSGRGGRALLLAPVVGALAYALYQENVPRRRPEQDDEV